MEMHCGCVLVKLSFHGARTVTTSAGVGACATSNKFMPRSRKTTTAFYIYSILARLETIPV